MNKFFEQLKESVASLMRGKKDNSVLDVSFDDVYTAAVTTKEADNIETSIQSDAALFVSKIIDVNEANVPTVFAAAEVVDNSNQAVEPVKAVEIDNVSKLDEISPVEVGNVLNVTELGQPNIYVADQKIEVTQTKDRIPPYINYVTFNRLGVTQRTLGRILESKEDFELHIIDCNSKDNSWDYVMSLTDPRIKSRTRFQKNMGPIFPLNYALTKRKPGQYFFTIDSDTFIKTDNWIERYMEIFEAYPEVGVLGVMRDNPYPRFMPPIIPHEKNGISYLELKNATIDAMMDFVPGQLQALRPELIDVIGYWSEECGYGDAELSPRVKHYTNFTVGFVTTVEIDMKQSVSCDECSMRGMCKLSKSVTTCQTISKKSNVNEPFVKKHKWKYNAVFKELEEGKRTAYCASIHDPDSMNKGLYHADWASENFAYYLKDSN